MFKLILDVIVFIGWNNFNDKGSSRWWGEIWSASKQVLRDRSFFLFSKLSVACVSLFKNLLIKKTLFLCVLGLLVTLIFLTSRLRDSYGRFRLCTRSASQSKPDTVFRCYRIAFGSFYLYVHIVSLFFEFWPLFHLISVSPGNIWTPLWDQLAQGTGNFEKSKRDGEEAQVSDMVFLQEAIIITSNFRPVHALVQA